MANLISADTKLSDAFAGFYADPLGYVMFSYPWDTYAPIQVVELEPEYQDRFGSKYGPDVWACQFLDELGQDILNTNFDGHTAVEPLMYTTVSGHGIGKSAFVGWITNFILDTRPRSVGTVTANTAEQLKGKTWSEIGKWHKMGMTEHWYDYTSGRGAMALIHKKRPLDWKCTAQTCREENSEAFAGQHAPTATSFYIFDEASAICDAIFEVREGGTTDGQPMVFDFGNGTRNSGRFFENCEGRFRHRYKVRRIDSRNVKITNKKRIKVWQDDYGEESDFFKVRVRGMFPAAGSCQFIPSDLVEEAQGREVTEDRYAPLLIGVDVARFGENESVIYPRIGWDARSWAPRRFKGIDTVQLTGRVIECLREFRALGIECSGLFVDEGGIGGAVVDQLRSFGYNPIAVQFGGKPTQTNTYRYKGDEMWGNLKDMLPRLSLPANNQPSGVDLFSNLTQREFGYTLLGNKIHLETKKDMIKRIGVNASPDVADALALTFAQEVAPLVRPEGVGPVAQTVISDYDPMEDNF